MKLGWLLKRIAWLAVVAVPVWMWAASRTTKDFRTCHTLGLDVVQLWEKTVHFPPETEHDLVDEQLHVCMLGKGYSYHPDGWEHCPTEKLPSCYRPGIGTFL